MRITTDFNLQPDLVDWVIFGKLVSKARKLLGIKREGLAAQLGLSIMFVKKLEQGKPHTRRLMHGKVVQSYLEYAGIVFSSGTRKIDVGIRDTKDIKDGVSAVTDLTMPNGHRLGP